MTDGAAMTVIKRGTARRLGLRRRHVGILRLPADMSPEEVGELRAAFESAMRDPRMWTRWLA